MENPIKTILTITPNFNSYKTTLKKLP